MRYGATISALLHVLVVVVVFVGFPELFDRKPPEMPIAVEVVTLDETPQQKEPQRKPEPPKPDPKPEPPKPAKREPPPAPPPTPTPPQEALKIPAPEPMPVEKPKPVPKPEAKPTPPPEPVPVPEAKPKPPPKPPQKAAEPEKKVAAVEPQEPAPKPKRKPAPPPDEFQSLLKNLAKQKREADKTPEKPAAKPVQQAAQPQRSALQTRMAAASLAQSLMRQVSPCWSVPAGARDAADMNVAVRIRLNPDGTLGAPPKIEDSARMGRDASFRVLAESAVRALQHPKCTPLKLPYDQYDMWREITFVFDPREALGQ
jgi:outer membrane biosynthesis protein TonB